MNCPRDSAILASNDVQGYRYYSCTTCRGVWIPGACIDRAMAAHDMHSLPEIATASTAAIPCPGCNAQSAIVAIEGCEVDICRACHGVWIDGNEVLRLKAIFPQRSAILLAARTGYRKNDWTTADLILTMLGFGVQLL